MSLDASPELSEWNATWQILCVQPSKTLSKFQPHRAWTSELQNCELINGWPPASGLALTCKGQGQGQGQGLPASLRNPWAPQKQELDRPWPCQLSYTHGPS